MKKIVGLILGALGLAVVIWIAVRIQQAKQQATVAELLPKTTLALAQVPDFNRTRRQWHESDVYQIWREPLVQAWLQKPLANLPNHADGRKTLEEFLRLGPTHCFIAVTSIENNQLKVIGGFHFEATPETTRQFVEQREAEWLPKAAKRETIFYQDHKIEQLAVSRFALARVYYKRWFLVSNDLVTLKTLLERAEHRAGAASECLQDKETFRSAAKHLPADFAGMFFVQPQPFVEKLMPLIAMAGQSLSPEQVRRLKEVHCVAGTLGFTHGKMREVEYTAMPRQMPEEKIKRTSLGLASLNTFFYSASLLHWPEKWNIPTTTAGGGLLAIIQNAADAINARGISENDLRAAFGAEVEVLGDWSPQGRWPFFLATLPVKDLDRAQKVVDGMTSTELAGNAWTRNERNGTVFYTVPSLGGFIPLSPTIALSEKVLIVGSDSAAVEGALGNAITPAEKLESSTAFREASSLLPTADSAFDYVDTRLIFERLDAAMRPLLLMTATFYPAVGKNVDLSKFPPPEVIAKHLSPIVMSQRYSVDGYVTESIGPITFHQATLALVAGLGGALVYFHEGIKRGGVSGPAAAPGFPTSAPVSP